MATTLLKQLQNGQDSFIRAAYSSSRAKTWSISSTGNARDQDVQVAVLVDSIRSDLEGTKTKDQVFKIIQEELARNAGQFRHLQQRVEWALQRANATLVRQAETETKIGQIGASVVIALFTPRGDNIGLTVVHVGNCRTYLLRAGQIYPLTIGHTWEIESAARGILAGSIKVNRPTRYLGFDAQIDLDSTIRTPDDSLVESWRNPVILDSKDRILLCTTGLRDEVIKVTLVAIQEKNAPQAAQALIKHAIDEHKTKLPPDTLRLDNPEQTDITALVVDRRPSSGIRFGIRQIATLFSILLIPLLLFLAPLFNTPTPISTPLLTSTEAPKPTLAETPTLLATATSLLTATSAPTATALPTVIPTPVPVALASLAPSPTSTPTNTPQPPTATPTDTPTVQTQASTEPPTITPAPTNTIDLTAIAQSGVIPEEWRVTLGNPAAGETVSTRRLFTWSPNFTLPPGYLFELIFWKKGQEDPLNQGEGWAGPSQDSQRGVDFPALGKPEGDYYWGVRLIKQDQRVKMLSDKRVIYVKFPRPAPTDTPARL